MPILVQLGQCRDRGEVSRIVRETILQFLRQCIGLARPCVKRRDRPQHFRVIAVGIQQPLQNPLSSVGPVGRK